MDQKITNCMTKYKENMVKEATGISDHLVQRVYHVNRTLLRQYVDVFLFCFMYTAPPTGRI